ncbi:MAG: histidine phosphatase family protein [Phycisphaerales bacterium]|nr:histidine phosphatase family protein [Phycisphaerales bacterium]
MYIKNSFAVVVLLLSSLAAFGLTQPTAHSEPRSPKAAPTMQPLTTDVVYIIRHADTQSGNNPDLSAEGVARVQSLVNILQDEQLSAVYVTNTGRSIQTGTPLAIADGISTTVYSPFDADGVAQTITSIPGSNATLVVAHSNTVPLMITALGGPLIEDLEETEFDRLFAVTLSNGRFIRMQKLHYE